MVSAKIRPHKRASERCHRSTSAEGIVAEISSKPAEISSKPTSGIGNIIEQRGQKLVLWLGKWVCHGHSIPSKTRLQVFGQKQPASDRSSGRKNDSIPNSELVMGCEIRRAEHNCRRGLD